MFFQPKPSWTPRLTTDTAVSVQTLRLISQVNYKAEFSCLDFCTHEGLQKDRKNFHEELQPV